MKILLISGIYRPDVGGPATFIPTLASNLLKQGHQVNVLTLRNKINLPVTEPWNMFYVLRDQFILIRFVLTVIAILKQTKKVDVIFANGLHQETAVALSFRRVYSVAKIVGDPVWERAFNNNQTNLTVQQFNKFKLPKNLEIQRSFLKWSLNKFNSITCPSRELCEIVKNWQVDRPVFWVANGVEIPSQKESTKSFDVICVSRLVKWKNLDTLMRACKLAKLRLAIVGSGPEEKELKALAKEIDLDVKFLGQLEKNEVIQVLSQSKVFALLSDYEGLSFSLLQAMSIGLPSVVSKIDGNTDVIENGIEGFTVDQNNFEQISKCLLDLIQNNDLRSKMGDSAIRKVKLEFNESTQIGKITELLNPNLNQL